MAASARTFEAENDMETRITRLETKTEHIESTLTDIKGRVGRIEEKLDAVKDSVTALRAEMNDKFAGLEGRIRDSFESLKVGRALDKVWALLLAAALLGVMARGFKWI
jgi:uncharacterized coiled-coil protein SlyX